MELPNYKKCNISIIGLGYVGLPLAIEFAKTHKEDIFLKEDISRNVIGFDINKNRVSELRDGKDITNEIDEKLLKQLKKLKFTTDINEIIDSDVFIITLPTPIDKNKKPDLNYLIQGIRTISKVINLKKLSDEKIKPFIVILESTVYPGVSEEICIPILEKETDLKLNEDFIFGYSPERINPGDKKHRLDNIVKVTSGSNQIGLEWIDNFYGSIIKVGTIKAKSIKTAEAAKVIENIQRDLNIALMNELMIIFNKLGINIFEVLKCSETKWNFLPFKPGLVGGHCISIDPYYLTYKSEEIGYSPEIILAGRRINDSISYWFFQEIIKILSNRGLIIKGLEILIMGFTFKENCPDIRNTKILDLYNHFISYGANPCIYEPNINIENMKQSLNFKTKDELERSKYKVIVVALAHNQFKDISKNEWEKFIFDNTLIFDLKSFLPSYLNPIRL